MPTGYTAAIKDGISFNDFVWGCARAFGALVMLRDNPSDMPIPEKFEPSSYHADALRKAQEDLTWYRQMPLSEAGREAKKDFDERCAAHQKTITDANALRAKYESMLKQIETWEPPTEDHVTLKLFMIEQISESIKFDCGVSFYTQPILMSAQVWVDENIKYTQDAISYHTAENEKEIARTNQRNAWIAALRGSLMS